MLTKWAVHLPGLQEAQVQILPLPEECDHQCVMNRLITRMGYLRQDSAQWCHPKIQCQPCSPALFSTPIVMAFWPHSALLQFTKQEAFTLVLLLWFLLEGEDKGKQRCWKAGPCSLSTNWTDPVAPFMISPVKAAHSTSHRTVKCTMNLIKTLYPTVEMLISKRWDADFLPTVGFFSLEIILSTSQLHTCQYSKIEILQS